MNNIMGIKKVGNLDIIICSKMVELLLNDERKDTLAFDKFKGLLYKYENIWYMIANKFTSAVSRCQTIFYVIYKFEIKNDKLELTELYHGEMIYLFDENGFTKNAENILYERLAFII